MRDANKLYSDLSEYKDSKRKIESATYETINLDEAQFRNLW